MLELVPERAADVERHLRGLGWLQPDEHVEGMAPAGAGNMNRTLRVRLRERSIVLKQSVPFVAKYPHIAAPVERIEVEAAFYRAAASPPALSMRLPTVLGFDARSRLLCLEDLGEGGDFTDVYRGAALGPGHVTALLHWLGVLHAKRFDEAEWLVLENRAMRRLNFAHIFEIPLGETSALDLDAVTPGLEALRRELAGDANLTGKVRALGEIYLGGGAHESPRTLLHGDFYPGSWLHDARMGVRIIDPEFAFFGPPELDLGVLLAHLSFAGLGQAELVRAVMSYNRPRGFSQSLALGFAGVEVIRRLLGVAQLPLDADPAAKQRWLEVARRMVSAG